jgi:hypothetical protein
MSPDTPEQHAILFPRLNEGHVSELCSVEAKQEASNLTTNSLSGLPLASAWFERALLSLKTLATPA